jgi:hypothetical protein
MMRSMRSAPALVFALRLAPCLALAACGGYSAPAAPRDHARVRLVRCRAAPALPTLSGTDGGAYGKLLGVEGVGGLGIIGVLSGEPADETGAGSSAAPERPKVAVALGAPAVTGSLAAPAIAGALKPRALQIAACAQQGPLLAGKPAPGAAPQKAAVEWRFTVAAGGKVIQADPTAHVLSEPVEACVTGVVRGAPFPAPPDGRAVAVTLPIAFDATGATPAAPEAEAVTPWTPFAIDASEAAGVSEQTARAAEGALRGRLAAIEACFAGSAVTGSLRAMLAVDALGAPSSVRAGGLGDKAIEACVENALTGVRVILPSAASGELACDLSRGDAQPWRVTPDRGGYGVVEISRTGVRHGEQTLAAGEAPDALGDHAVFVLVVDADAPGALLARAMRWTGDADATLVAVRAANAGAAPQLLGAGHTAAADDQTGEGDAARAMLEVGAGAVTACAGRWKHAAKLADPAAIDGAVQRLAARCRTLSCLPTLVIAIDRDAVARALAQVAGAARRAGFERVLFVQGAGGPPVRGDEDLAGAVSCTPPASDDDP